MEAEPPAYSLYDIRHSQRFYVPQEMLYYILKEMCRNRATDGHILGGKAERLLLSAKASGTFTMLPLVGIALALLTAPASCDDTVADDVGSHMMARISELLTPEECQAFYAKLLSPEENVKEELERLSAKKNPIPTRSRRDISIISTEECRGTLLSWLETEGDTMYWDRLSRALQAIGRSDISMEMGKNLNQDKTLEIKKNVEGYHKTVKHLTSSLLLEENEMSGNEERSGEGRLRREGKDSKTKLKPGEWDDLELIIERKPLPPFNKSLFEWVTPVATGIISGFLTSFVLAALALYSFFWILNQGSPDSTQPSWDSMPEMIFRSPSPRRGGIYYTFQRLDELETYDGEPVVDDDDDDGGDNDDNDNDGAKEAGRKNS